MIGYSTNDCITDRIGGTYTSLTVKEVSHDNE